MIQETLDRDSPSHMFISLILQWLLVYEKFSITFIRHLMSNHASFILSYFIISQTFVTSKVGTQSNIIAYFHAFAEQCLIMFVSLQKLYVKSFTVKLTKMERKVYILLQHLTYSGRYILKTYLFTPYEERINNNKQTTQSQR